MNAELKEQVRVAAYDANNVPAISPDERIRVYTSKEHVCHCIPITNRSLGLTVPILEDGKTVEYWFEKGIRDVDLVLKHNSSIGDEYIFDDNVFKIVSPDQIKHRIYLKDPHIELLENSIVYTVYNEQTDKKEIFTLGTIDNLIYLDLSYIDDNDNEKSYFYFDKNQFKIDINGKINLKYNDGVQNGMTSSIEISDGITLNYLNGNINNQLTINEDINLSSVNAVNVSSNRVVISSFEGLNIISGTTNSTSGINIENRGTGDINLILNNRNSDNDILIKNIGNGDIKIESNVCVNIKGNDDINLNSDIGVNITALDTVKIYGTELAELKSTNQVTITCADEILVHGTNIIIEPTTRFTVNGDGGFNYLIDYQENAVSITNGSGSKKISLNSVNGVELCNNSGINYLRFYDPSPNSSSANIEMGIGSSNSAGSIYIKNNGTGAISIYRNNSYVKTEFALDSIGNGFLKREFEYNQVNESKITSLVSVNNGQVLIRAYDDVLNHEYSSPCHIELRTGDHAFHVATEKLEIGKLNDDNILSYQGIPECIYPLLYDLDYTNSTNIDDGGYWNGNAGQTDLRDIQRFTSVIPVDNSYSYIEFRKETIPNIAHLSNNFNIKTFTRRSINKYDGLFTVTGRNLTFKSNKNNGTTTTSVQLSFDEDSGLRLSFISSGIHIRLDETEISFTDDNTQTTLSKTWQQLLS